MKVTNIYCGNKDISAREESGNEWYMVLDGGEKCREEG